MTGEARKLTSLDWITLELVCAAATASGYLSMKSQDAADRIAARIDKAISNYIDALKRLEES